MMTNYEILHIFFGIFLWVVTWELFLSQYFYTRSEKAVMLQSRGEGRFTTSTLLSNMINQIIFGAVFFYLIKYIF